jgi:hypothetical protein
MATQLSRDGFMETEGEENTSSRYREIATPERKSALSTEYTTFTM